MSCTILVGRLSAFHHWVLYLLWVCHKQLLLSWDMFPLYTHWQEFLSWMDVEFCQMLFLHLFRGSCGFCLFFCWGGLSHWLICLCWTILVNLGWISFGHSVCSFLCVVRFGLLIFCLHLYSSNILACNFLFWWCLCLILVSGWR